MADIQKELNDIKNAVYGREVRSSIHDGIKKINEESEESKQKAEEAHEITQDLLDETFDSAALEANFAQRLNDEIANLQPEWTEFKNDVTSQLAQKANQSDVDNVSSQINKLERELSLVGSVNYGTITLPNDFKHDLTFDFWRDVDGMIKHNYNVDREIIPDITYYVHENGNPNNDGLSKDTPLNAIEFAIDKIEENPNIQSAKIVILSEYLTRNRTSVVKTITKNIVIEPEMGVETVLGTFERNLSWETYENIYKTQVPSSPLNIVVFDRKFRGEFNLPKKYEKVNSIQECIDNAGTYHVDDNSYIYVHRLDGSAIDNEEVYVCLNQVIFDITVDNNATLVIKDLTLLHARLTDSFRINGTDGTSGKFVGQNIKLYSSGFGEDNGFRFNNLKSVWMFDCLVLDVGADGFNYHTTNNNINNPSFAFEYNCAAFNCGVNSERGTRNCTTAHDGMHILRVNSKGDTSKGPVLADVNGCYSINYDCVMNNSLLTSDNYQNAAFCFDDSPWQGNSNPDGKAILINCSGGDNNTYGINCDESFKAPGKITISNFRGKNIPDDIQFKTI